MVCLSVIAEPPQRRPSLTRAAKHEEKSLSLWINLWNKQAGRQVYKAGRREDNVGRKQCLCRRQISSFRRAAADRFSRAGRTPRVWAMTRRRMCCCTQQHLFLVSFSLTGTYSLSFPPHAAKNKNKTFTDIQTQSSGYRCPFCVHADVFSHTKSLKTNIWISSVNFGYNHLFSTSKSHFFSHYKISQIGEFLTLGVF
jgi:hypothetical protein